MYWYNPRDPTNKVAHDRYVKKKKAEKEHAREEAQRKKDEDTVDLSEFWE